MSRVLRRYYWDSCVFLSYIENTPQRADAIEALLAEADAGKSIQIFTSTLSISEVSFAQLERSGGALDATIQAQIDELWRPSRVIVVELNEIIARAARDAVQQSMLRNAADQQNNPILRGADACHLATAQWLDAKLFCTYDKKILRQNGFFSFPIDEPTANVQQPLF